MASSNPFPISGKLEGKRVESRILDETIRSAVASGYRHLTVEAFGQHGLGGRLWISGSETLAVHITGHPGQRVGAMGSAGTAITVYGPASDDVGWLNAGADITILGNAGNGVGNAMAQGRISVAGSIGARGMTMTKHNPRFAPPELWVLGSAGDYFGQYKTYCAGIIVKINKYTLAVKGCFFTQPNKVFLHSDKDDS